MTEMAETHVELNQFPVPRVGPRHSTHYSRLVEHKCYNVTELRPGFGDKDRNHPSQPAYAVALTR